MSPQDSEAGGTAREPPASVFQVQACTAPREGSTTAGTVCLPKVGDVTKYPSGSAPSHGGRRAAARCSNDHCSDRGSRLKAAGLGE